RDDAPRTARRGSRRRSWVRRGLRSFAVEVLRDLCRTQQAVDVRAFVETLVGDELKLRGIFHADAVGDLALKEGGVLAKRLQHCFLVLAEERLHEHGCVAEVGGHAHLCDADQVSLQHFVMHVAALKQLAQDMAHLFADAEEADRTAFGSFGAAHQILPRVGLPLFISGLVAAIVVYCVVLACKNVRVCGQRYFVRRFDIRCIQVRTALNRHISSAGERLRNFRGARCGKVSGDAEHDQPSSEQGQHDAGSKARQLHADGRDGYFCITELFDSQHVKSVTEIDQKRAGQNCKHDDDRLELEDVHPAPAQSVLARSSTSNTSSASPGLMSLVSASSTPHSRPEVTSATSSLNRRSELIVVFETMTSSRVRRALRPLRMTPSSTSRPAALSFLPAGKTSW